MTNEPQPIVNQPYDDKGPLKGKGGTPRQWRDDAAARLSQLTVMMAELAVETRAIAGRRFGLQLYGVRGGRQLRWRFTSGRHTTWACVEPELHQLSAALAQWYRQVDEVAQMLNSRERVLRFEVKAAERLTSASNRFPGPIQQQADRFHPNARIKEMTHGHSSNPRGQPDQEP